MRYYLIAGEASGDLHGANLMLALMQVDRQAQFRFWGGDRMAAVGGELVQHYRDTSFMGFAEVLANLYQIWKLFRQCKADLTDFKPKALILIDYPGFNMRIGRWAKQHLPDCKIFYYISPQVWAWKSGRAIVLKEMVDRMFVILPFEAAFYRAFDFEVTYVGHPLLDHLQEQRSPVRPATKNGHEAVTTIALLPGSRQQEIVHTLPVMASVARLFPQYRFVIAGLSAIDAALYQKLAPGIEVVVDDASGLLAGSKAALIASGTATLEAALLNVPQVVCYRGSQITYHMARRLIRVKYLSLVNLILDRPLLTELIQQNCSVPKLRQALEFLLQPDQLTVMQEGYCELRLRLGGAGASARVAQEIRECLSR